MAAYLSPVFGAGAQLFNNQGVVLAGGKINTYLAGSTTPLATWTDSTQIITNANPIILDSAGRPQTEIWFQAGTLYKLVLMDANNNVLGTWDNIAGLNDITSSVVLTEWADTNLTPSFINTTSFSVAGNNTATFPPNRRVKIAVSAGTVYGYVVSSAFTTLTTIVIQSDSLALDSGISAVAVGLLSSVNSSYPQQLLPMNAPVTVASATTTPIGVALSANVIVSGVATITAFDTVLAGILRFVKFSGILTLTHNGTSLILPGAANITTQVGDQAIFRSLGSGNWECVNYITANWRAINVTGSAVVTGAISSSSPTAGIGYATGAGGTVTQSPSITSAVTLNTITGKITTAADSLTALTLVNFTFNNTNITTNDTIKFDVANGFPIIVLVVAINAGNANIGLYPLNNSSGQRIINFTIFKGSNN